MITSYGHDQDAEPPTPDNQEPDVVKSDGRGEADDTGLGGGQEPASHPDPEPGTDHAQAGSDS
jgi:hypothetical protein